MNTPSLKLLTLLACFSIFLSGCTVKTNVESRVSTDLKSHEFNEITSAYMPRPTFVSVETRNKIKYLHIKTNEYGKIGYNPKKEKHIYLHKKDINKSVEFIDKFLEWERIASDRKDQISKEIGRIKAIEEAAGSADTDKVFEFYSGNTSVHYLVISSDLGMNHKIWDMYFPKEDVLRLRELLIDFKNDKFKPVETEVYK